MTWADVRQFSRIRPGARPGALSGGQRLYSAAYVITAAAVRAGRKHTNHLRLLEHMMDAGTCPRNCKTCSGDAARRSPNSALLTQAIGDFLAFQFLIDLNYSEVLDFDEMDFVVAGPGARDGLRKCFGPQAEGIEADLIRYMAEHPGGALRPARPPFPGGLRGRPLQLIDCQNLFCEVDKYARVAHPDVAGLSGRSRIKQKFSASASP